MLPNLPRILNKREAKLTPKIMAWFEENYPNSVALEIKIKGNKIKGHQLLALQDVADGLFSYKIVDTGIRLPFDCFILKKADAFLVSCAGNTCVATSPKGKTFTFTI